MRTYCTCLNDVLKKWGKNVFFAVLKLVFSLLFMTNDFASSYIMTLLFVPHCPSLFFKSTHPTPTPPHKKITNQIFPLFFLILCFSSQLRFLSHLCCIYYCNMQFSFWVFSRWSVSNWYSLFLSLGRAWIPSLSCPPSPSHPHPLLFFYSPLLS